MATKYFLAKNAGSPVAGLQFEQYDIIGGTAFGVYQTDDARQIATLEALIGKSSVISISKADYETCLSRRRRESKFIQSAPSSTMAPEMAIKGDGAVVTQSPPENAEEAAVEVGAPVAVESALETGPVEPPPTPEPVAQTKAQKRANWDSKKKA